MISRRLLLAGMTGFAGSVAAPPLLRLASVPAAASTWEQPGDLAIGAPEAPITVIEYFSLTCPHCRDFHTGTFPRVRTEYVETGKVRFIARDFPLNRPALDAAVLAHCAGPERYFAFVETLFNTFDNWTRAADYLKALAQIGQLGGVSEAQFLDCLGDQDLETRILTSIRDAQQSYGVKSTPSFVINGNLLEGGLRFSAFAKTLDSYMPET
jgi:protein-disulfide isomerase